MFDLNDLLPKSPRVRWDGFFLIGIFPPSSPVRWLKFHLFVGEDRRGRVPIATLEGMGGRGEIFAAICLEDRLFSHKKITSFDALRSSREPFFMGLPGRLELAGSWPVFSFTVDDPASELNGRFSIEAHDRQQWCRLGHFLSYFGLHSILKGQLNLQGKDYTLEGLGILEHAWGTDTRIPLPRLIKGFWHWDVLWFGSPEEPYATVAALAIAPFGPRALPFRGGGRVPGEGFQTYRGLKVVYAETRDIGGTRAPVRWRGSIENRSGTIRYSAHAVGSVLKPFEYGAFLGFDFEGTYEARSGSVRRIAGTGFTEFSDPGSHTARISGGR